MATADYPTVEQLLAQASRLDRAEQRRLLDALIQLLQQKRSGRERVSITALRGLGRSIWNGVDAQEYVDRERQAWGG
ncbi:MAG: hypothetical protein JOZ41_05530 [Chloroflexi bacterium]|nr:hypothetical protein [Chloroflexota bacterium]